MVKFASGSWIPLDHLIILRMDLGSHSNRDENYESGSMISEYLESDSIPLVCICHNYITY